MDATHPRWPFVGRSGELEAIDAALRGRDIRGLVIVGAAGIGKTRLAEECGRLAEASGSTVMVVRATRAASSIPLAALAPVLPVGVGALGDGVDAVRAAGAAILQRASGGRSMLIVDDAHLLDDVSATVLQHVTGTDGLFVVATVRAGERAPDPVTVLWKDGRAVRLDLAPLSRHEALRLASDMLGGRLHPVLARDLWRRCAGNVLYLGELVRAASESGRLAFVDGRWRLTGPFPTSARLIDLVDGRVGRLEPDERHVLELVAFGEPVSARIVGTVVAPAALEALERRGLVARASCDPDDDSLRLGHPLYGEVVRAQTPTSRVNRLHEALADAFAAGGGGERDDIVRIAAWRLGEPARHEPGMFMRAARQARATGDLTLAERLARAAHRAGGGAAALDLLAGVTAERGHPVEAEDIFAEAMGAASTDAERAMTTMGRATNFFAGLARPDAAIAIATDALASIGDDDWHAEVRAHRAGFDLLLGHPVSALADVAGLLRHDAGRPFVQAAIAAVPALVVTGRSDRAEALAASAFAVHSRLGDLPEMSPAGVHLVGQVFALRESGRLHDALRLAELAYDAAGNTGSTLGLAYFGMQLAGTRLAVGRVRDAAAGFEESAAMMRELALPGRLRWSLAGAVHAHALAGNLGESDRLLHELDHVVTPERLMDGEIERARAWNAIAHGRIERGHLILVNAAETAARAGMWAVVLTAQHDLVRLGCGTPCALSRTPVADVEGAWATARRQHAEALLRGDADSLDAAAGAFERLGADLHAAEAFSQAAAAHTRRHGDRSATASNRRSRALADRCQGASTPALGTTAAAADLTRREHEIAALAADGLGNPEIARELFLSVRTVENHLGRAYTKLGIAGRHDLPGVLRRPPADCPAAELMTA